MATIRFSFKEEKPMIRTTEVVNEERKSLRGKNYKLLIRQFKNAYNRHRRSLANPKSIPTWNDLAKQFGIYYIIEKNQDIIDLNNDKMINDILTGNFFREDWEV